MLESVDTSESAETVTLVSAGTAAETPLVSIEQRPLRLDSDLPTVSRTSPSYVVIAEPEQKPARVARSRKAAAIDTATRPTPHNKPRLLRASAPASIQVTQAAPVDEHAHLYTLANPELELELEPQFETDTYIAPAAVTTSPSTDTGIETVAWHKFTVKKGDTFSTIMDHYGVSATQWREIMRLKKAKQVFSNLRPGKSFELATTPSGWLEEITYKIDRRRTLRIWHNGLNFTAETIAHQVETRVVSASGNINSSLFSDGREAGLNSRQIMNLAQIFKWQIDFAKDIHRGDKFVVVYEAIFQDNEQIEGGEILAAAFTNRGKQMRAVR